MKIIRVLYVDAGGGHASAAKALKEIIEQETSWQVELVNPLQDIAPEVDLFKKFFNKSCEKIYNDLVSKKENTLIALLIVAALIKFNVFIFHKKLTKIFRAYWQEHKTDMIISVVPFINGIINDSIKQLQPKPKFVTLITDYGECAGNTWLNSKDQLLICSSSKIAKQASTKGLPADNIYLNSGMVVSPSFYKVSVDDKAVFRQSLGLKPKLATGIVMFGSYGSSSMIKIAKRMHKAKMPIQLIFICGHNDIVKNKLLKLQLDYPHLVLGFTKDVQNYMAISDFFIGKPGGISISEASIMKLPMIVTNNLFTLLQEKYNAKWLEENNIGICIKNFRNIASVVKSLLNNVAAINNSYQKIDNKGIFEIPYVLEKIFQSKS